MFLSAAFYVRLCFYLGRGGRDGICLLCHCRGYPASSSEGEPSIILGRGRYRCVRGFESWPVQFIFCCFFRPKSGLLCKVSERAREVRLNEALHVTYMLWFFRRENDSPELDECFSPIVMRLGKNSHRVLLIGRFLSPNVPVWHVISQQLSNEKPSGVH